MMKRDEFEWLEGDELFTNARGPSVVVHVTDDGTIVADGPDSQLASGDINSQSDVTVVLQAALDVGGNVTVKGPQTYTMGVSGTDPDGVGYCIELLSDTDLELEAGVTLEYPAKNTAKGDNNPDVASPIWIGGQENVRIKGKGTVDGGVHDVPMHKEIIDAMGIKAGASYVEASKNKDVEITGITVTGASRHGIEVTGLSERAYIHGAHFYDASGDDDVSIEGSKYVSVKDCWSIDKLRDGPYGTNSYEAEDGAEYVLFEGCYSVNSAMGGFEIGKSHQKQAPAAHHTIRDCYVINPETKGVTMLADGDPNNDGATSHDITIDGLTVVGAGNSGISFKAREGHTIKDVTVKNCRINAGANGVGFENLDGSVTKGVDVHDNQLDVGNHGVVFESGDGTGTFSDLSVENEEIDSKHVPVFFKNTETEYEGDSVVKGNDLTKDQPPDFIRFSNESVRKHVRTLNNGVPEDRAPVRPANPEIGMKMYAAASLRSTSYPGYDYYDAVNSQWREM